METLTTTEAAARLQVSPREVRRLAASGMLTAQRIGTALVFDGAEVHRLQRQPRHPGRLWAPRTAWAALELLDGEHTELIDQPRRSRLLARLRGLAPEQLHRLAAKRAEPHRFHASDRALLRLSRSLSPTGVSAVANEAAARRFGLAAVTSEKRVDGYLRGNLEELTRRCRLTPDPSGNATVRLLPGGLPVDHLLGSTPVVAIDLMDSAETRERGRGRDMLEGMLRGL
jgi:excisionase family DNA binding protein